MRAVANANHQTLAPSTGFAELSHQTTYESPTGDYTINVFLMDDGKRGTLLGSTSVHVKEFQPDRMKIEARLSKELRRGWVAPEGDAGHGHAR